MKNFINFLPPWVETNIQPAFYDKESGTCIQQTARMYAKVNQLVRHFNDLSKDMHGGFDALSAEVAEYIQKFIELHDYVDDYFDNLDVQEEVNNKLDAMLANGDLGEDIQIATSVANYQKSVLGERIINNQSSRVSCVGDSLTWCQKPSDTSTQLTTWSSMLEDFINTWYNNNSLLTCDNFGVKGEVSSASLTKFNSYVANSPQTIFWAYGTNDMNQGVTVDQFLGNLKDFYKLCVNASVELIVIIAPPSFQSQSRRDKMLNLAKAERIFCEKYGIKYVDMFEYVDNLYSSQSATHNTLQSDNTHFSDYTCYRDAILSSVFGVTFNQNDSDINYIDIGKARNFFHCNGNEIIVAGGVNMFNSGYRLREEVATENEFSINIQLKKKSKIYFLTYGNNTAGKINYSINGDTAVTINTRLSSTNSSGNDKNLCEYIQIGGVQNAGLVNIKFDNPDYTDSTNNGRIYVFGFIVEEIPDIMIDSTTNLLREKQSVLWAGDETLLTDADSLQDVKKYNKLLIEFGAPSTGVGWVTVYNHEPWTNFTRTTGTAEPKYNLAIPTSSGLVAGELTIDIENNTFSFTGDGTVKIRRIIGLYDNALHGYNPNNQYGINAGIDYQ